MVEVYLISTGLVFLGWLYVLVRQTQNGVSEQATGESRPIVPVNVAENDEAVLVAVDQGRIVFANDPARQWFGVDGGVPSLSLIAQMIQPSDALHDLLAHSGHASFRLGQRRIEAASHAIPEAGGTRMVVVMRELTGSGAPSYTAFDPLRALAILGDIGDAIGTGSELHVAADAVLQSLEKSIEFDAAQVSLWDAEAETLQCVKQRVVRTPTGSLVPPARRQQQAYDVEAGYGDWIARYRQPLLVGDVTARADVVSSPFETEFQSYLGVPLLVADRFIGTLEMVHRERNAFGQRDLTLLQTIAGQVAATFETAVVYHEQTERVAELSGLQEISHTMSLLGEPRELYAALTEQIANLSAVDICGVLVYDERERVFRSQLPFYGIPDMVVADYRLSLIPDSDLYSIWRHQPWWYSNQLDSSLIEAMGFETLHATKALHSLALVPMIVGARRVGLLLVANRRSIDGFTDRDMRLLMSFASQAAVVTESARMYVDEQRRTRELGGLQQIAQAIGVLRNPDELYAQITERIATLMEVRMCGVLLFDSKDRVLVSQQPFYGLGDDESVNFYQLPSPLGGPIASLWLDNDYWYTNDLRNDPVVGKTDLARMGGLLGFNRTVWATLTVGGNRLGVIQAANKIAGGDFNEDDARILSIFAGQAAILIDNARLYREMQRRTHEAEGLRAITEIAAMSAAAPFEQIVERVLIGIANLVQCNIVALGLVDEETGTLDFAPDMTWGASLDGPYRIDAYAAEFEPSALISRRPFATNDIREDRRTLPAYRGLADQLNFRDVIIVPLVIQDRSIGELLIAQQSQGEGFTPAEVQLSVSIGTQLAAMIDRMRLYQETDQDIRARLRELDALGRVTRELSRSLELSRVLDVIRAEALRSTAATSVTIALLRAADDVEGQADAAPELERRLGDEDALPDLVPIERAAAQQAEMIRIDDYESASLEAAPARARAAIAMPVTFGDQVLAVIHLYSDQPDVFDAYVGSFARTLADQAAIAVGNARRYQDQLEANRQLQRRTEQLQRIFDLGEMFRQGASLRETLERIAEGIRETVGFNLVLVSLVDEAREVLVRSAQSGLPAAVFEEMQATTPPLNQARGLMQDAFRISNSYFLPAEGSADLTADLPTYQALTKAAGAGPRAWNPEDLLLVPLYGSRGRLLGLMSVDEPRSGSRPDLATIEALEIFANQAAFSVENYRLVEQIRQEAEAARRERDRLAQLHMVASEIQSAPDVPSRLQVVADGIHQAGWGRVIITLRDERLEPTALISSGYTPDEAARLTDEVVSGRRWREWLNDLAFHDLKLGAGYYLRYSHPWVGAHIFQGEIPEPESVPDTAWHPQDVFYLPLVGQDQKRIIGMITMREPVEGRVPSESSLQPFDLFAAQAAAAIETSRLFEQAEQRATELDAQARRLALINRVALRLAQATGPDEIYETALKEMQEVLGAQYGGLILYQADRTGRLALDTHPDSAADQLSISLVDNPVVDIIRREHRPVTSEDVLTDPRFAPDREALQARGTRSMMIIPLIVRETVTGTIGLDFTEPRVFTDAELELGETIASQVSVALEKAQLLVETEERASELDAQARRLALINRVSARLAQTLDPQEIYRIVLSELAETLQVQYGGLVLFEDEETGWLAVNYPLEEESPGYRLTLKDNLSIERVRETLRPLVSPDVLSDPLFEQAWDVLRLRGTQSLMIVPLLSGEQVIGTIGLDSTERREFSEAEIELAEIIAGQASLATEKARLYSETLELTIFNQAVVESIQQGIVVLDQNMNVRRVNRFMLERYGWDADSIGQPLFEYRPDYEDFLREPVAVALGMGEQQSRFEVERADVSGQRSIRNYYVYPMLEGRNVTGIVLLVEDVSERARLEADLEQRAVQMAALTEVSSQMTSTLEPDQVIDLILDALKRVVPFDGVSLWLQTPQQDELYIAAARGYEDTDAPNAQELMGLTVEIPYSPLFAEMAENARVINVGDVGAGDPRFPYGDAAVYKNWLGAPMISKGKVVGVMALEKREAQYYTSLHEQLVLTFANQAAVALDNAQLFQETRARAMALDEQAQRLALLNRVSLALAQTLDLENIFEIALREAAIALEVPEGQAMQIDNVTNVGRVIVEYPRGDAPPTETYDLTTNEAVERVRRYLIPLVIEHVPNDPLVEDVRPMLRRDDIASLMLVPLVVGGEVIGLLRLDAVGESRSFPAAQVELAQTIASQAAIAVQNASLFEQSANRTRELETLFESAQATAVTLDLNEVVRRVTMQMLSALRADACSVFLWDDVNNQLELKGDISARSDDASADQPGDVYAVEDYPLREQVLRERRLIMLRAGDEMPLGEAAIMQAHQAARRLLIPLVVNDISIGLVEVETLDPFREFKQEDMRLARTLASQAAISIENARLQTETRRTVEELYIINDMSTGLSSAQNLDGLLDVISLQLPSLTDAQYLYVALYDAETELLSFPLALRVVDDQPEQLAPRPLGEDEFSMIVRRESSLLLAGENIDQVRLSLGISSMLPATSSFLGVPLFAGDELIGVLAVRDDDDPLAFTHNDQRILTTIGAQLGVAIQGARLFQQTLEQAEELERRVRERTAELEQERQHIGTLYQITTELVTSLDMDRLLNRALEMVARAVGATQGAILALDPVNGSLSFRAHFGWPDDSDSSLPSLQLNEGLAGWAIRAQQNVIVKDVQSDPRWLRLSPADDVPRAAMVALIEANDDVLGVIMLYSAQVNAFHQDQLRLVSAAANQVANAMNNAELYNLIRDQAERLGDMLRQEQVEATKSDAILESVADGVMVADENGQVIVFNSTAERILGLPAKRVLNQSTSIVAGLYGAGATRWAETVELWMRDPSQHLPGQFLEERITLEDERIISVRLSPVYLGTQFLGTVSIFRDITREVEVDRLKSEFVATVSHELRTPMTSIKGYADLLLLGAVGEVTDQQQHFLETIKQNADRLSILVNDLLDISRIDQGRMDLKPEAVSVNELVASIEKHLHGRVEDQKKDLTIATQLPDDDLMLWGDYDKVAQILTNLADNAFNYTPEGGRVTISAERHAEHDTIVIAVADTGVGIAPAARDRIFERFFRGDETHELVMDTPGTGLGLAIVKEFVDMHGGDVWFESKVGEGTTFYVELPARVPAQPSGDETALESQME